MKLTAAVVLSLFISSQAFASVHQIVQKVQGKITEIDRDMNRPEEITQKIPWQMVDSREAAFWKEVNAGYELLLKKQSFVSLRKNFTNFLKTSTMRFVLFLFCFILFYFVLFCFVLFCFV